MFVSGDTVYVAGTHTAQDVLTDMSIPIGRLSQTNRYKQFEQIMNLYPEITQAVGHSLGASIVLEYLKNNPQRQLITRTYAAPVISGSPGQRYRHYGDFISALDFGAQSSAYFGDPHS